MLHFRSRSSQAKGVTLHFRSQGNGCLHRALQRFLPLPVDPISKAMTHPLRSTGITPQRITAVRWDASLPPAEVANLREKGPDFWCAFEEGVPQDRRQA